MLPVSTVVWLMLMQTQDLLPAIAIWSIPIALEHVPLTFGSYPAIYHATTISSI